MFPASIFYLTKNGKMLLKNYSECKGTLQEKTNKQISTLLNYYVKS